jgi:hypothetical protein
MIAVRDQFDHASVADDDAAGESHRGVPRPTVEVVGVVAHHARLSGEVGRMTVLQPGRYVQLNRSSATPSRGTQALVGHLVIDTSRSVLCPQLAGRNVAVTVDDLPLHVRWGRTDIALPAGRHRVEVVVDRGDGWGRVVEAVPVAAGHTVDVYYRAPALPGRAGSLGPGPQSTVGVVALLAMLLGMLVLLGGIVGVGISLLL